MMKVIEEKMNVEEEVSEVGVEIIVVVEEGMGL